MRFSFVDKDSGIEVPFLFPLTAAFTALTKEYVREFTVVRIPIEEKGKYSFVAGKLTMQGYKKGVKEFSDDKKIVLDILVNESGFEYMWKYPDSETPFTCTWKK